MAKSTGEQSEHVFSDCRGVIFILESDEWKELIANGGLSLIQLVRNTALNYTTSRIRGILEKTRQVILNVDLNRDVTYGIQGDPSTHLLRTKTNAYMLRLSQDSNGKDFALVVQSTINSLQGRDSPCSPRAAWMPAEVSQQQLLFSSSNLDNKEQFRPQLALTKQRHLSKAFSASTPNLASPSPTRISQHPFRTSLTSANEVNIEELCITLSDAIRNGDIQRTTEISRLMSEQRLQVVIKLKNPKIITMEGDSNSFKIKVVVEDRETSGGTFEMKVSSYVTIQSLQDEVADRYGFPPKVQKWIVGKKMAQPKDTLASLNIKSAGFVAFLYLVSGKNAGLKREEFEEFVKRRNEQQNARSLTSMELPNPASNLSSSSSNAQPVRTSSSTSLNNTEQPGRATSQTVVHNQTFEREVLLTNQNQPINQGNPAQSAGNPVLRRENVNQAPMGEARRLASLSIGDIEQVIAMGGEGLLPEPQERMGQEESMTEPQGWSCKYCTFVNPPTRPGCEVCGADRPSDYIVPQNPWMTEQERLRLQKEQEEVEVFQRTLNRQQEEQQEAREINFRQMVQTAQQNLIRNTEEFDCAICFLNVAPGEGVVLRECLHCFCEECLREHIKNCTDPEVQCPFQDNDFACHFVITAQEIKALLSPEDFNKFLNRSLATAESQAANSFHCKTPNCPGWCIYEDNSNVFQCQVCQKVNCLTCKAIHHPEMNCKEYQDDLKRRAENDVAAQQTQKFLEQMITKGDAMKCPRCAIILLKKDGCDWMRCSMCKLEICWATRGPRWGPAGVGDLSGGCKCRVGGKKCHPRCKNCH